MSKYKAEKIVVDGYKFDSKIEAKYYEYLKELKAKGLILNFELQPEFELQPNFESWGKKHKKIMYRADFLVYGLFHLDKVIDIKGMATPEAKLKRKLFNYKYPNYVLEWLVWYKGEWMDYDKVQKIRRSNKREKLKDGER